MLGSRHFHDGATVMTRRAATSASGRPLRRVGVIGDVHAEHERLAAALEWMHGQRLDAVICTGDVADGPGCVDACCRLLREADVATVRGIYEVAGLEMTPDADAQIQQYLDDHPRGKEGRVVYDLREDFGADPADVRAPFDFYRSEFDVRSEVK